MDVEVRRSPRARRWRLEVPWGQPPLLTVPRRMTAVEIDEVLAGHRGWIDAQRRCHVPRLRLDPFAVSEIEARVAAHELCHLHVPNHSKRFWALVEQHRPEWRDQRGWLHEHGPELLAFRPAA